MEKVKGIVKFFDKDKGYGFIKIDNGRDIFVHVNQLYKNSYTVEADQTVIFEIAEGKRGLEAHNVEIV